MKKTINIVMIIALILGIATLSAGLILANKNWNEFVSAFTGGELIAKTITEDDTITSIKLDCLSADIEIYPSTNDKLTIEYFDFEKPLYQYSNTNGEASFSKEKASIAWWERAFLFVRQTDIKIYLPTTVVNNFNIELSSGSITFHEGLNIEVASATIQLTSGDSNINNITADQITITNKSGSSTATNLRTPNLNIDSSSGKVKLDGVVADSASVKAASGAVTIENSTIGDLTLSVLSGKTTINNSTATKLSLHSSSGRVTASGLKVDDLFVKCTSGDINLEIIGAVADYNLKLTATSGNLAVRGDITLDSSNALTWGNGAKPIVANVTSGSILIKITAA